MEDALALAACCTSRPTSPTALAAYEAERRPVVLSTQRAAQASLEWFENLGQYTAPGADAVRVQHHDPSPPGHLRQPAGARPRVRRRRRRLVRRARGRRGAAPAPPEVRAADVPAVPAARPGAGQPRRRLRDGHVLGRRRRPRRLPPRPPRRQGARRRRAGHDRDGVRVADRPHHARLHRAVHRRAGARRWRRIVEFVHANSTAKIGVQLGHSGRKGSTKLHVGGHRRAAARRQLAAWSDRRRCPYTPASTRCRASSTVAEMAAIRDEFVAAAHAGRPRPASTCSNCTARTGTCCRASCRR